MDITERRRFDALVLPHLDAAHNLARWLCRSASDADDVVQEAFLRAFRLFASFRGEQPRPWLLAIVRNTWYTMHQQRKSAAEVSYDDTGYDDNGHDSELPEWHGVPATPEQLMMRDEDARLVHAALERLPVAFREVIVLRELEDLQYRDIARIVDIPAGTVMSRLARGRRMLAAEIVALRARAKAPVPAVAPSIGEAGHGLQ